MWHKLKFGRGPRFIIMLTSGGSPLAFPPPHTFEALGMVGSQANSQVHADSGGATGNEHYCEVHVE